MTMSKSLLVTVPTLTVALSFSILNLIFFLTANLTHATNPSVKVISHYVCSTSDTESSGIPAAGDTNTALKAIGSAASSTNCANAVEDDIDCSGIFHFDPSASSGSTCYCVRKGRFCHPVESPSIESEGAGIYEFPIHRPCERAACRDQYEIVHESYVNDCSCCMAQSLITASHTDDSYVRNPSEVCGYNYYADIWTNGTY